MKNQRFPSIPERIHRLEELAFNLEWSWDYRARLLFKRLDQQLWKNSQHNPVRLLNEISPNLLIGAANDPDFLREYEVTMKNFDRHAVRTEKWFPKEFPELAKQKIGYFSAEFGLHTSLPIYSGGLGILAGDHCKESSDLGIPLVGAGFVYPQGYFHQRIQSEGWQEDVYELLERKNAPIESPCPPGERCLVELNVGSLSVFVMVWRVNLGSVPLYLMDTDVEENPQGDRELSARLYGGDKEHRIRQEIVLGIGGYRVLRALGIRPAVCHANEGHTAFMLLERARELVQEGMSFTEAAAQVRLTSIFTTHTPVPAGHDAFPFHMMEKHFDGYWDELKITKQEFFELGKFYDSFNMTVLALNMTKWRNGVSELHGRVSRRMWQSAFQMPEDQVPISSVTNGVHAPTWIAPELGLLFDRYMGPEWIEWHDDNKFWNRIMDVPDEELWNVHLFLKRKMLAFARERARARWSEDNVEPKQVIAMGTLLDPDALTIGFARRFTGYKRAALIFQDMNRIKSLMLDRWRPVQIIFAGKAHPADEHGKHLIHQIYSLAADHGMAGHVAFFENYEMHSAHFLTQGVDVWLNNPRPPLEACGTSGQKAAMNGTLNVSVLDGWWYEGYNGNNGWAIGDPPEDLEVHYDDNADADALYALLEQQVVPLFYERDHQGIPHGWVQMMKETLRSIVPRFCARRMLKDYASKMYVPAALEGDRTRV